MNEELNAFLKDKEGGKGLVCRLSLWNEGSDNEKLAPLCSDSSNLYRINKDNKYKLSFVGVTKEVKEKMEGIIKKDKIYFNSNIFLKTISKTGFDSELKNEFKRIVEDLPIKSYELNTYSFFDETSFSIENGLNMSVIVQILDFIQDAKNNRTDFNLMPRTYYELFTLLLKKYLSVFNEQAIIHKERLYYSLTETFIINLYQNYKSNKIFEWHGISTSVEEHYYNAEKLFLSRVRVGDILINNEKPIDALVSIFNVKYLPQKQIIDDGGLKRDKYINVIQYITFEEYFNLLENGTEKFYIPNISRKIIWNGYRSIDNPNYKSNEEILESIPKKRELILKIQENDIIKEIGGFERFVQQEKILLEDIMKDNVLLCELYDSIISGEYFKVKNNTD